MRRRDFLVGSALAAGSVGRTWGQGSDKAKRARIGVHYGSISSLVKDPAHPDDPKRTFELLDLPQMYAEHLGVHYMEPTCAHFASTEKDYLDEFKARLKKAGIELNQISLGGLAQEAGSNVPVMTISSPERNNRIAAIDLTKQWVDHAAYLGCPRVMLHQGNMAPGLRKETIAAMKAIVDYAKTKNVKPTLELRGNTWQDIVEVVKGSGGWTNCHSQNPPEGQAQMFALSSGSMHISYGGGGGRGRAAKQPPRDPDEALHEQMQIVKQTGYKGIFSIEHGGPDPYPEIKKVVDGLLKEI